jgi:hypothetical protein
MAADRPTRTVAEAVNSVGAIESSPDWLLEVASRPHPTEESDEGAVLRRAQELADAGVDGNTADHWIQAVIELKVAQRAEEIARCNPSGTAFDNWTRAERELKVAQRATRPSRAIRNDRAPGADPS